jgi:CIC family chloride channel protein
MPQGPRGNEPDAGATPPADTARDAHHEADASASGAGRVVRATRSFARPHALTRGTLHLPALGGESWTARLDALGLLMGRRLATVVRDDHLYMILMAAFVGIAAGVAAAVLLTWIERAHGLFPRPGQAQALRAAVVVVAPVLGGLLAGALQHFAARWGIGSVVRSPAGVVEAVALRGGEISGRSGLVAGLGTGISIGSGGSVGHEGPSVALGATVGSVLARFFGLRARRKVAMVGAGCAGGLAAAFNAPLAGVIFTVELVFRGSTAGSIGTLSVFIPLVVAAVAGTFTSHAIFGRRPEFDIVAHAPVPVPELGFFLLLAVLAGGVGAAFTRVVLANARGFRRLPVPEWVKPAVGGLGVGLLAVALSDNDILGTGRATVEAALHGELVLASAALLLAGKGLATALTVGSGGFGGVFMPSLCLGTCLGTLVAAGATAVTGAAVDPSAYALVGMGAVFSAMMHAPLTPIVMIFELTRDYGIILPLMLGCILASLVSRRLGVESFDRSVLRDKGVALPDEAGGDALHRGRVRDLMQQPRRVLTRGAGLEEIRAACMAADLGCTFVVDGSGVVIGYLDGRQLARRMLAGEIEEGSIAAQLMGKRRLGLLVAEDPLASALLAFARAELETLPVVDDHGRLLGELHRGDVLAHWSDRAMARQEGTIEIATADGATPAEEVVLGPGMSTRHVVAPAAWTDRPLGALDLEGRGLAVLEWRRGDESLALERTAPLREGDRLVLLGPREALVTLREV